MRRLRLPKKGSAARELLLRTGVNKRKINYLMLAVEMKMKLKSKNNKLLREAASIKRLISILINS